MEELTSWLNKYNGRCSISRKGSKYRVFLNGGGKVHAYVADNLEVAVLSAIISFDGIPDDLPF